MHDYPKVLYCIPDRAEKPFIPSNGTEGMIFMSAFCDRCRHEVFSHTGAPDDAKCGILSNSLFGIQPPEWKFNSAGWPVCTAWSFWDFGDPDDDEITTPPPVPFDDPNQLCIPFAFDEMFPNSIPQSSASLAEFLISENV